MKYCFLHLSNEDLASLVTGCVYLVLCDFVNFF